LNAEKLIVFNKLERVSEMEQKFALRIKKEQF